MSLSRSKASRNSRTYRLSEPSTAWAPTPNPLVSTPPSVSFARKAFVTYQTRSAGSADGAAIANQPRRRSGWATTTLRATIGRSAEELRAQREPHGEPEGEELHLRRAKREESRRYQERREDNVGEARPGLDEDDREERDQERAVRRLPWRETETAGDAGDAECQCEDRCELSQRHEAVGTREQHRPELTHLRVRWALIEAHVICGADGTNTVLLAPERRARELVDEGVAVVRRGGQRDDARVCVGYGAGGQERREPGLEGFRRTCRAMDAPEEGASQVPSRGRSNRR